MVYRYTEEVGHVYMYAENILRELIGCSTNFGTDRVRVNIWIVLYISFKVVYYTY